LTHITSARTVGTCAEWLKGPQPRTIIRENGGGMKPWEPLITPVQCDQRLRCLSAEIKRPEIVITVTVIRILPGSDSGVGHVRVHEQFAMPPCASQPEADNIAV